MVTKALSLVGVASNDQIRDYLDRHPEMMVELPYNMDKSRLEDLSSALESRVASIHACCPSEIAFPNFGSGSDEVISESFMHMRRTLETARRFSASLVVLHPGYATDKSIPSDGARRLPLLHGQEFHEFVGIEEGSICKKDYTHIPRYKKHFETMREHVISLSEEYQEAGVRLALENLNPRAGYLNVEPYEQISLAAGKSLNLCLDIGHLWISSQVFGFEFIQAVKRIMATGKVISVHLHSNSTSTTYFVDSHENIDANLMPVKEALKEILPWNPNLVLETLYDRDHNTEVLEKWLGEIIMDRR